MHIDYLNATFPESVSALVSDGILEILDYCGAVQSSHDSFYFPAASGSVKLRRRNAYGMVSFSGGALEVLREKEQYSSLLWVLASHPHRITLLDIAHDVSQSSPKVLESVYRRSRGSRGIRLSGKRVKAENVTREVSEKRYGERGTTGTVYVGKRTAEVRFKVYDKRNQLINVKGHDIGYDLTRYELTVTSKMGISLKDAQDPESLFWHFMARVLPPPAGVSAWVAGGQGFVMPERKKVMPAQKLKDVVGESPEIERWLKYADAAGPNGREYLLGLLRRRILVEDSTDKPGDESSRHLGDQSDSEV